MLTEAFKVNLEELVTKEYLTAEFAKQDTRLETKIVEKFAAVDTKLSILTWMLGLVVLAQVRPFLEWFFTL